MALIALKNPYCTLIEVQTQIRNFDSDENTQNAILSAINRASRWIDRRQGRDFFMHDFSTTPLTLDKHDEAIYQDTVFLPFKPVISIAKVQIGMDGVAGQSPQVLVKDTDYLVKPDRMIHSRGDWWSMTPYWNIGGGNWNTGASWDRHNPTVDGQNRWPVGEQPSERMQIYGLFGYDQRYTNGSPDPNGTIDHTQVPYPPASLTNAATFQDDFETIRWAAVEIAKVFSGLFRVDKVGITGDRTTVTVTDIPDQVLDMLGPKQPILV